MCAREVQKTKQFCLQMEYFIEMHITNSLGACIRKVMCLMIKGVQMKATHWTSLQ